MRHDRVREFWLCLIFSSLLLGHVALADIRCDNLFQSKPTADRQATTEALDSLFPSLQQIQTELATNAQESAWRGLNRRLDKLYLNLEKTDFLKVSSEDLLFSMALRLLEIQKDLESGPNPKQLRVVFAEAQQDTIQDIKSQIYSELRTRGVLKERLIGPPTTPVEHLTPLLQRDFLILFGSNQVGWK